MQIQPTIEADFTLNEPFELRSGARLPELTQRFTVYGEFNDRRDNAILVFHALTGSALVHEWWADLIGARKALDTNEFAIICVNYIGSCYGSTGANSINPTTGEIYAADFPLVTTRDIARAQLELLKYLKVVSLRAVVGGSVGGQLALQFAADFPEVAEKCVAIGACELSAMALALNHLQREALRQTNDVGLARAIATLTYKSAEIFEQKHGRKPNRAGENPANNFGKRFDIAGYLDYQSECFRQRFDVHTYKIISKMMDLFELSDGEAQQIKAETALVGISSDWLFPARDVRKLCNRLQQNGANANYVEMISPDGHDAFLTDTAKMSMILKKIL